MQGGTELHSFDCTTPTLSDYSLTFEEGAKRLVCQPAEDYAQILKALGER